MHIKNNVYLSIFFLFLILLPVSVFANVPPHFLGGRVQTLVVCQNSNPNPIDTLLRVSDPDVGQTESWTLFHGAFHGSVTPSYTTTSTGSTLLPTAMNYTPNLGYHGSDTFAFSISDGIATDTTTVIVTVVPFPHVGSISGLHSVCTGQTITMTDTPSGGSWYTSIGNATVSSGGVVLGVTGGIDTVIYRITNMCGMAQNALTITIHTSPNSGTISGADSVCLGSVISLFETSTIGVWSATNTHASISITGVLTTNSVGIDTILYTATNTYCTSSAKHVVTVNPIPHVSVITGPLTVCQGVISVFTDSVSGGVWSCSNSRASVDSIGRVTGVTGGLDTLKYIYTNACGTSSASKIFSVNPLPVVDSILGLHSMCIGSIMLLADSTPSGVWSSSSTIATVSGGLVTAYAAGIDTIKYTLTNSCGPTTAKHIIEITSNPVAGIITGNSNLCIGTSDTLTDTTSGGTWSIRNSHAIIDSGRIYGLSGGLDTVLYYTSNTCGTDSALFVVTVNPLPNAGTIYGSTSICPRDSINIFATVSGGTWSSSNPAIATVFASIADTAKVFGINPGSVVISYSVANSCGSAATTYTMNVGFSSICPNLVRTIIGADPTLLITPNPNSGNFVILLTTPDNIPTQTRYTITNILGVTVFETIALSDCALEIGEKFNAGIYFITTNNSSGSWNSKMIVAE